MWSKLFTRHTAWRLKALCATSLVWIASCTHTQGNLVAPNAPPPNDRCEHDKTHFRCVKFIKNYDGDTITVEIPNVHPLLGEKISVRVNGIDAPEMRGRKPCEKDAAISAQRLVESLLKTAKQIDLINVGRDKYFRILADVSADGQSVRETLLNSKLAYEYDGGTKSAVDWCGFIKR